MISAQSIYERISESFTSMCVLRYTQTHTIQKKKNGGEKKKVSLY